MVAGQWLTVSHCDILLFVVILCPCSLSHIHIFVVILVTNLGTKTSGLNEEELGVSTRKAKHHFSRERGYGSGNYRNVTLGGHFASLCYRQSKLDVDDDGQDQVIYPIEGTPFADMDACRYRYGFYWIVDEVNTNYLANLFHIMMNMWKERQKQMEITLRDFQFDTLRTKTSSGHDICIALAPAGVAYTEDGIARLICEPTKKGSIISLCGHDGCYVQLDANSQLPNPSRCIHHQKCIGCNNSSIDHLVLSLCGDCHTTQQSQRMCRMKHVDQCNNTVSSKYGYTYCSKQCENASLALSWCQATNCYNLQDMSPNTVVPREKYHNTYTQTSEYIGAGRIFTSCGRGLFCTSHWQDESLRICRWCGATKTSNGWQCDRCLGRNKSVKQKLFNARLPTIDE